MTDSYILWKTTHVISAAVLFGTGLGIAFFAWFGYRRAMRVNSIDALRAVLRLTVIGDSIFTAPAVVFQILSGFMLLHLDEWSLTSSWALTVYALFIMVGMLWLPVVYIQIVLSREADRAPAIMDLGVGFHRRFITWFVLGIPAFIGVIVLFFMMIAKPLPVVG